MPHDGDRQGGHRVALFVGRAATVGGVALYWCGEIFDHSSSLIGGALIVLLIGLPMVIGRKL